MENKIIKIVNKIMKIKINNTDDLRENGLDSLDLLKLVIMLEDEF